MGISSSKRVAETLRNSTEFNSACDSEFENTVSLSQHAFKGLKPYQLSPASLRLHHSLLTQARLPLITRWVPQPPTRTQIDSATRRLLDPPPPEDGVIGAEEFRAFAAKLFGAAAAENAGKAVMVRVPVGAAGIAGVGAAVKAGREVVGAAIGVYALGVAAAIYVGLAG